MSISNYVFPQNRLYQYLTSLAQPSDVLRSPVLIGARYRLSRYGKETVPLTAFAANAVDQELPFTYINEAGSTSVLAASEKVDTSSVRVYGKNLEYALASFEEGFKAVSAAQSNVLKINSNLVRKTGETGTLNASFAGRNCEIGDVVYVTDVDGGTTYKRSISGFLGVDIAASNSNFANSTTNPVANASADFVATVPSGYDLTCLAPEDFNGLVEGVSYKDPDDSLTYYGDKFTFTVVTGGDNTTAQIKVTSASGKFSGIVTSTAGGTDLEFVFSDAALGGLSITLEAPSDELTSGSTEFSFVIYGAYARLSTTQIAVSGTYTGAKDTTYTVEVIEGDASGVTSAVVRITDSAGVEQVTEVSVAADNTLYDLGENGLQFKFNFTSAPAQGGLRKGDIYYLTATAVSRSATQFDKIILNGPSVNTSTFVNFSDNLFTVEFRGKFSGYIGETENESGTAWSVDTSGVTLVSPLKHQVAERSEGSQWCAFVDNVGEVALSYRALRPPQVGSDIILISDSADITDQLGTVDLDNDIAFAASECFSGAQGLKTYVLLVSDQTAAEYAEAVKKIRFRRNTYALCPVSTELDVIQAIVSHCEAMSVPNKKFFRRCYYGVDSPGKYSVLTEYDDTAVSGTIIDYLGTGNRLVTLSNSDIQVGEYGLQPGDIVKLTATGVEYTIAEILNTNQILLEAGPAVPVAVNTQMELWRANTPDSQADFVRARAKTIASRRAVQVWTENGKRYIDGTLTVIPNKYIAAHVAGLRCALPKQRGLTRTEITTVSDCAAMYLRYSSDLLDLIAADGTFIVTQDAESGTVYVRHQLTTDVNNGSLAYEDNVGIIVDELSFKTDDIVGEYIGTRNLTTQTLTELLFALRDMLFAETQVDANNDLGPALIRFEGLKIVPDTILKDRAKIFCKWIVPLPFNIGDTYITVDQDVSLAVAEIA
jgi:hypothetical protein